ncbi:hypothetical protein CHUAL_007953 [Chamberlinius hualienensis]
MNFFHCLTIFMAISGVFSDVIFTEELAIPDDYKYVPHPIENLGDLLKQEQIPRINSSEDLKDVSWNNVIDNVFKVLDKVIVDAGLDPFNVFTGSILGVGIDVWIGGYSSMAREGDASVQFYSGTTAITCMGNMVNLAGNLSLDISFLGLHIRAGGNAQIESVDFKIALRFVEINDGNGTVYIDPIVDDFQVANIGKITVQFQFYLMESSRIFYNTGL